MKIGDKVQVRNINADPKAAESWFDCEVVGEGKDGILHAKVTQPGHKFNGIILSVDGNHIRASESA